ncbi:MAG TPA: hypothetical protein VMM93_13295 [Vicinamibacterales bacterium]|nr:hypothetical protein [Vicinamibacterales bacterium]
MVRGALVSAGALLVAFHVWLFAGQIWSGELAHPGVALQWVVAGVLVWALGRLRRQGESMFRGRRAVAVWLLAALLHAPAVADRLDAPGALALPEVVATLASSAIGTTAAVGFVLLLGLLAGLVGRFRPVVGFRPSRIRSIGPYSYDSFLRFAPRPPPLG